MQPTCYYLCAQILTLTSIKLSPNVEPDPSSCSAEFWLDLSVLFVLKPTELRFLGTNHGPMTMHFFEKELPIGAGTIHPQ